VRAVKRMGGREKEGEEVEGMEERGGGGKRGLPPVGKTRCRPMSREGPN